MTVFDLFKGCFGLVALVGVAVLCLGGYRLLSGAAAAGASVELPGEFVGYHTVEEVSTSRSSDRRHYRTTRTRHHYPMFRYRDPAGVEREVTAEHEHLFAWFEPRQAVRVLHPAEGSGRPPRLGDAFSLYARGAVNGLVGLGILLAALWGLGRLERWYQATRARAAELEVEVEAREGAGPGDMSLRVLRFVEAPLSTEAKLAVVLSLGIPAVMTCVGLVLVAYQSSQPQGDARAPAPATAPPPAAPEDAALQPEAADPEAADPETADAAAPDPSPVRPSPTAPDADPEAAGREAQRRGLERADAPAHVAAREGDAKRLEALLAEGERVADLAPSFMRKLIHEGRVEVVRLVVGDGFDVDLVYHGLTFGDWAVVMAQAEVVRLVRERGGRFSAPPQFVALAAEDEAALREALQDADPALRWRGKTIDVYADKHGRRALLDRARAP